MHTSFPIRNIAVLCLVFPASLLTQTRVDLQNQTKRVDFSAAPTTRPIKLGTTLPITCTVGEMFFKSDAPSGGNLYGCVGGDNWQVQGSPLPTQNNAALAVLTSDGIAANWLPIGGDISGAADNLRVDKILNRSIASTAPLPGQALTWNGTAWEAAATLNGQVGVSANGTPFATRGYLNFVPGPGVITTLADTGTTVNVQQNLDTAVVLTRAEHQRGTVLSCNSASASPTDYTCAMTPPLAAYTAGMLVNWVPDVHGGGGINTLAIDGLEAKGIKLADGATDPASFHLVAGQIHPLWYDGVVFRLAGIQPSNSSAAAGRPACGMNQRGRFWHSLGAEGVKDEVAVCAKDATDGYVWRILY